MKKSLPGVLLIESDRAVAKEVIDGLSGKARVVWHKEVKRPEKLILENEFNVIVIGNKDARHVVTSARQNNFRGIILANTGHKKSNKNLLDSGAHFLIGEKDSSCKAIENYI